MATVRPTTLEEKFWLDQVDDLKPQKWIERLDSYGKYLLGTASALGTVLTGFGIFSSPGSVQRSRLLLIPIILACISLALAVMGITPRVEKVKLANPDSTRDHYRDIIRNRGRFIVLAGWLFAASLFSAGVVLLWERGHAAVFTPKISFTWTRGDPKSGLDLNIKFESAPRSALVETKVLGAIPNAGEAARELLFQNLSRPDSEGNVEVSGKLDNLGTYGSVTLMLKTTAKATNLYSDVIEIPLPQQPAVLQGRVVLPSIHFGYNDMAIPLAETAALDQVVASLKAHTELVIRVVGYSDAKGSEGYNLKLSRSRALAVAEYLENRGIPRTQLVLTGFGKTNFVASNDTADGRARNRRVDLLVLGRN